MSESKELHNPKPQKYVKRVPPIPSYPWLHGDWIPEFLKKMLK